MKFYTYTQALNCTDLMMDAGKFIKLLAKYTTITNAKHKSKKNVAVSIFLETLRLIVQNIIDTGNHFQLPIKNCNTEAILHIAPIEGDDFKSSKRSGRFKNVDYYLTNFKAFRLYLTIIKPYKSWNISVYLPQKFIKQIDDNANKGITYF